MKKTLGIISVGILAIATVFFIANTNDLKNEVKLSEEVSNTSAPTKGQMKAELETFNFDDAVANAELIAEVEIGKQIKEIDDPAPKTLFEATVKQVLKGTENLENIEVLQQGNSEWSFNDNNQFSPNEKYILFLKKAVGEGYEGSNVYWILGEETNIYSIVDGNKVVKNSLYEEDLKRIEEDTPVNTLNLITKNERKKDIQILNKEKFEKRIVEIQSKTNSN
ncbi:hypothetical protein I2483_17845 [Sporosarcina sp. E16_3]|uniref:hypothetical protein n=1 Tax=Sporosarcina sp. E16_3 TaxID=2789293 RepID=UPI001A934A42|nr:hypothetical protein [Sporosarcina sp. E16_3]MBO0603532.1 hypothetical protein [Sporosarcina sp. E16_3]